MRWDVTTPPTERPVTWAECKAHLRLGSNAEQAYVEGLIDAATDYAEQSMGCSLVTRTITASFEAGECLTLPRGPLVQLLSATDADGLVVTAAYRPVRVGRSDRLVRTPLSAGPAVWPLAVVYRAGFGGAGQVPAGIRHAIRMHVATLYGNREHVTSAAGVKEVPGSLTEFYRLHSRECGVG